MRTLLERESRQYRDIKFSAVWPYILVSSSPPPAISRTMRGTEGLEYIDFQESYRKVTYWRTQVAERALIPRSEGGLYLWMYSEIHLPIVVFSRIGAPSGTRNVNTKIFRLVDSIACPNSFLSI